MINCTKGGWKADKGFRLDELYFVNIHCGDTFICRVSVEDEQICKANAQLIASAPDLYEALKLFMERKQGFNYPVEFELPFVRAEQALAKTEGK